MSVLDLEALIQPIPGDRPAGAPLADTLRLQLDDLRKEPDPLDPSTSGRKQDWPQIIKLTTEALTRSGKDLITAVRLLEAVTKKEGAKGLRDGLKLLSRLVHEAHDRLHPMPEPGETYEVWEGAIKWINDATRGGQFPATVGRIPVVIVQGDPLTYEDWIRPDRRAAFEELVPKIKPDHLRLMHATWSEARDALRELARHLDDRMGADVAPDLVNTETSGNLGNAIQHALDLIEELARRIGLRWTEETETAENAAPAGQPSSASEAAPAAPTGAATREALYRRIAEIADQLERLEPHSPIPMLLRRCVRLGGLPFNQLIREMVRDGAVLDELDRLLGVSRSE